LGPLTLTNCLFDSNQAIGGDGIDGTALGGAISNGFASLTITNSTIMNSLAKGGDHDDNSVFGLGSALGGGILNDFGSTLIVTNSAFIGNRAVGGNSAVGVGAEADGGGISNVDFSTLIVTNSTFTGNQAIGRRRRPRLRRRVWGWRGDPEREWLDRDDQQHAAERQLRQR